MALVAKNAIAAFGRDRGCRPLGLVVVAGLLFSQLVTR